MRCLDWHSKVKRSCAYIDELAIGSHARLSHLNFSAFSWQENNSSIATVVQLYCLGGHMKTVEWEIEGLAEERKRREAKKKNDAFRQRLKERKEARYQRIRMRLMLAIMAAILAWTIAAIRYFG